ncbi:MAG: aminotransferase class I/II-fold pyridoxal phosphate-dependent enzyme [Candidatus Bipolaricaulaceae bacterium]
MDHRPRVLESPLGPRVRVDGREYDYFCGTSYYCLHGHPQVVEAACQAARQYGLGPGTAWDVPPLQEVERRAAAFFAARTAQYIVSGYLGNFFLVHALRDDYDVIFVDRVSHYSVFDAIRSVGKPVISFAHLDADDLERKIADNLRAGQVPLAITDGIFPVTGAMAPLADYHRVLGRYPGSILCVDDSHGVGVVGARGRGSVEHWGLTGEQVYFSGTLSKAFGGFGGIIPGPATLVEKTARHVRVPVAASPPPVPAAAAAAAGLRMVADHPEMRERLWANTARLRAGLREAGFPVGSSPVPIVALPATPDLDLAGCQQRLEQEGILVKHVAPGGYSDAPPGGALRIAVFSEHSPEQLDRLVNVLGRAV